jgi:hypothetical protein
MSHPPLLISLLKLVDDPSNEEIVQSVVAEIAKERAEGREEEAGDLLWAVAQVAPADDAALASALGSLWSSFSVECCIAQAPLSTLSTMSEAGGMPVEGKEVAKRIAKATTQHHLTQHKYSVRPRHFLSPAFLLHPVRQLTHLFVSANPCR